MSGPISGTIAFQATFRLRPNSFQTKLYFRSNPIQARSNFWSDHIPDQTRLKARSQFKPIQILGQVKFQARSNSRPVHISGQITFFGVNIFQLTTQAFSLTYHTSQPTLCFSSAESIHLINQLHPIKKMSN